MEVVTTVLLILLTLYCVVMYLIGLALFVGIMKSNGGIDVDDLKSLDFWGLVLMMAISPISIPVFAFRGD